MHPFMGIFFPVILGKLFGSFFPFKFDIQVSVTMVTSVYLHIVGYAAAKLHWR